MSVKISDYITQTTTPITATNLSKSYGEKILWRDLSLVFNPGELNVLHGKSGCGKTTLLNCIAMLEEPDTGSICWGERKLTAQSARVQRQLRSGDISVMLQNLGLIDNWSVLENLTMVPRLKKQSRKQRVSSSQTALNLVGLAERGAAPVFQLSGGEQQRVAFARALLQNPSILLVDEPTASLDSGNSQLVTSYLKEAAAAGAIVICSTHDPELIAAADNRVQL